MFAPRYFGVRYYPPRYFAPGAEDLIVQQPIASSRSAPAGGPLLRKPRRPRIQAYTPAWEYYEEAILALVARNGNREQDRNDALLLLQNVAFGTLDEVANILFRMKLRGIPHTDMLELLYFLPDEDKALVGDRVRKKINDDEIVTMLLLDGGL